MATVEEICLIPLSVTNIIKVKGQRDKKLSTKHYARKAKDQATRIPLKTGDELTCSERANSSCSASGIRRLWSRIEVTTLAMVSLTCQLTWILSVHKTSSVSRTFL